MKIAVLFGGTSEERDVSIASAAQVILASYRSTYPRPKLQEEHDGLRVIADCLQQRVGAAPRARHFLSRASTSLLAARIKHACNLGD